VGGGPGRLETAALVDRDVDQDRSDPHLFDQGVGDQLGGARPNHQYSPYDDVGVDADLLNGMLRRGDRLQRAAEVVIDLAQPVQVAVEHVDVGVHPHGQRGRGHARHPGPEDDHPGGADTGDPGHQDPPATARAHEVMRAHQRRHPPRHLAHGGEQRQ
jgi:hypothetical protein